MKGPHVVLRQLRRLVVRNAKTLQGRKLTDNERRWCTRAQDTLERLVQEGDQVLPVRSDPRHERRVRKRHGSPGST